MMTEHDPSKRQFVKTAAYVAPAILTLKVTPTFASGGSGRWNGNPGSLGEEPGNGGESDGGGEYSRGGSAAGGSSSSYSVDAPRKKKRKWYWPFN